MAAEKTEAIVLRLVDFSETSVIVTLMTRDFGKISALAKGAKRKKSPFENALDLMAVCDVVFIPRPNASMELLTEAKLDRRFRGAEIGLNRLYAGYYVIELLRLLTTEDDPHPAAYDLTKKTLRLLDRPDFRPDSTVNTIVNFELGLLRCLGHQPLFTQCVGCGKVREGEGRVSFGLDEGGVLCSDCKIGKRNIVSLSAQAWQLLKHKTEMLASLQGDPSNVDISAQIFNPQDSVPTGEVRKLLNNYISHLLGFPPKLHSFIN